MVFLPPPTTDFPPDPEPLSREDLNSVYLELRNCYKRSMRSRGQHRSLATKAREETAQLKQRLLDLAAREASVSTDIYQMLEIVTAIAGDLEDAGDDLVNEFGRYKLCRKTYQGGSFLGGLVQAVIRFINRWTQTKERVVQLDQKRQELIEKTKDLPPFVLGGNGHNGPVKQSEASAPAKVELVDSPAASRPRRSRPMRQLTDTLRATLRDLAQSDPRLYRGLQEELGDPRPASDQPAVLLAGDAPASREVLERLSVAVLWSLGKARGIKGLSKGPAAKQVDALLSHPDGPPLRSAVPSKATKGSKGGAFGGKGAAKAGATELKAMEQRLDRLKQLVLLIAQQVGVPPDAIARLLPPAAPPT